MRLLLDTHIFLWLLAGDTSLTPAIRDTVTDLDNVVFLSPLSLMEAIIKYQIGKLALPQPPDPYLRFGRELHDILPLPLDEGSVAQVDEGSVAQVDEGSVAQAAHLPLLHRDPFNRLLMGQAIHHKWQLVTAGAAVRAYPTAPIMAI